MKNFIRIIMVLLLSLTLLPFAQAQTFVEQDDGYGYEGLYSQVLVNINIKAKQFISEYNQQHHTNWQSHKVNFKTAVTECAVELKAKWEKIILGVGRIPHKYVIAVYCEKTLDYYPGNKWSVGVPVYNEQGKMITSIK